MATMNAVRVRLETLLTPLLREAMLELEEIELRPAGRRRLLRILVDREHGGVTLDEIAEVTSTVSRALDESDVMGDDPYTLEVSSPGVDRPLTRPRHWRRNEGRLVTAHLADGRRIVGRVRSAGADSVELDVDGKRSSIAYGDVVTARVEVEFTRPDTAEASGARPADGARGSEEE